MKDVLSTRLSIRKRGNSLGHHQAIEKEERFSSWRSEEFSQAHLDAGRDGRRARLLRRELDRRRRRPRVGHDARGLDGRRLRHGPRARRPRGQGARGRSASEREKEVMERFEKHRPAAHEPRLARQRDAGRPDRRACSATRASARRAAQILGQAYVAAQALIEANRVEVEAIADTLIERRELHGDEVVALLERHRLTQPEFDLTDDDAGRSCERAAARTGRRRLRGAPDARERAGGAGRAGRARRASSHAARFQLLHGRADLPRRRLAMALATVFALDERRHGHERAEAGRRSSRRATASTAARARSPTTSAASTACRRASRSSPSPAGRWSCRSCR